MIFPNSAVSNIKYDEGSSTLDAANLSRCPPPPPYADPHHRANILNENHRSTMPFDNRTTASYHAAGGNQLNRQHHHMHGRFPPPIFACDEGAPASAQATLEGIVHHGRGFERGCGRGRGRGRGGGRFGRCGRGGRHVFGGSRRCDADGGRCHRKSKNFRQFIIRFVLFASAWMMWLHKDALSNAYGKAIACLPTFIHSLFTIIGNVLNWPFTVSQLLGVVLYSALVALFITFAHAAVRRRRAMRLYMRWTEAARARHSQTHDHEAWPIDHQSHNDVLHGHAQHCHASVAGHHVPLAGLSTDHASQSAAAAAHGLDEDVPEYKSNASSSDGRSTPSLIDDEDDEECMSEKSERITSAR